MGLCGQTEGEQPWYMACFCVYNTVKIVKINDYRVAVTHKFLLALIVVFALWLVFDQHGYCEVVPIQPSNSDMVVFWDDSAWVQKIATENNTRYCNGSIDTNFYWGDTWQYLNNTCGWNYKSSDFTGKIGITGLWATVNFGIWPADYQSHVDFVPHSEYLNFELSHKVNIRHISETPIPEIKYKDGWKEADLSPASYMEFSIKDMLAENGVAIDDYNDNEQTVSDVAVENGYPTSPLYRLTGFKFVIKMHVSNFENKKHRFDNAVRTNIEIEMQKAWTCPGFRYMRNPNYGIDPSVEKESFTPYACDMRIDTQVEGNFCFFSWYMLLNAFTQLVVLFSVASMIVNQCFTYFLNTFKVAKYNDQEKELILDRNVSKKKLKAGSRRDTKTYLDDLNALDTEEDTSSSTDHQPNPLEDNSSSEGAITYNDDENDHTVIEIETLGKERSVSISKDGNRVMRKRDPAQSNGKARRNSSEELEDSATEFIAGKLQDRKGHQKRMPKN